MLSLLAAASTSLSAVASASERIDCAAVNMGALNADLAATASTVREVALEAGDRLVFSVRDHGGDAAGTVALVAGAPSPRKLLFGPSGTATYAAVRDGTFAFRFTRQGDSTAAFTATCTPASASRGAKDAGSATAPRWANLPPISGVELPEVSTDPAALNLPPRGDAMSLTAPSPTVPSPTGRSLPKPPTGLDARLKWEGNSQATTAAPSGSAPTGDPAPTTTLGVKYKLQPQIMLGVLAQFDQASNAAFGASPSPPQQPWLAGPTATVQLAPGLALDARAAWGTGEASALDHVAGIWTTERRLVDAKLASTQSFGAWRFSPSVTLNYAEEKPAGTTAATHDPLAPRTTGAGRIDVTPELAYRIEMPQAMFIEPKAAIGSFWDIDALSRLAPRGPAHEDMRLKAEAGVTIGSTAGTKLEVGGGVEDGGPATPDVWTGRLQLSVPMK
jgi:hypothetical protein